MRTLHARSWQRCNMDSHSCWRTGTGRAIVGDATHRGLEGGLLSLQLALKRPTLCVRALAARRCIAQQPQQIRLGRLTSGSRASRSSSTCHLKSSGVDERNASRLRIIVHRRITKATMLQTPNVVVKVICTIPCNTKATRHLVRYIR